MLGIEGRVDLNLSFLEPKEKNESKYGDGSEEENEKERTSLAEKESKGEDPENKDNSLPIFLIQYIIL